VIKDGKQSTVISCWILLWEKQEFLSCVSNSISAEHFRKYYFLVKICLKKRLKHSWLAKECKINFRRLKVCLSAVVVKKKEPLDVRNFDYSARSWTGKSPKQFLIDWCRKNFPKSPNPAFEKVPVGKYWKCRYVFPINFTFSF